MTTPFALLPRSRYPTLLCFCLLQWLNLQTCHGFSTASNLEQQQHFHPNRQARRLYAIRPSKLRDAESLRNSYSEQVRKHRRTLYKDETDWLRHRSSDRFARNLWTIAQSGVANKLRKELTAISIVSVLTVTWNALLAKGYTDFEGLYHQPFVLDIVGHAMPLLSLPPPLFSLTTSALGLLLVFRTNASYSRWLDGRKSWGSIVNNSRNIVRMATAWSLELTLKEESLNVEESDAKLERVTIAVWLFARSLQRHLHGKYEDDKAFIQNLREKLPTDLANGLIQARHKPTRALLELSCAVDDLPMDYLKRIEIEKAVMELCNASGSCERIYSSPVPLLYTQHTARFLALWLLFLPLGLYPEFSDAWNHVAMIPSALLISYFLFGIEELSIQLEEPFSILPLGEIVENIQLVAQEHLDWYRQQQE